MHGTPSQDDTTVLDEALDVDGNSEDVWVPVGDFLDNDQAFTEAMHETFEHTYILAISLLSLGSDGTTVMHDIGFTVTQGPGANVWNGNNRTGMPFSHP